VIRCNNEKEIITSFTELIRTENPNIIVGYNILNFDIPYMIKRSIAPCNIGYIFDTLGFHKFSHAKKKVIKWTSSAYKNQEFEYLDAEGRLFIDLLPLVKRDFKMDNYKLKTVSDYFLGQTKDDLSVKGIFKCYRIGTKKELDGTYSFKARKAISVVSKYCIKDSELVVRLMNKLQTWVGLSEMSNCYQVQPFTLFTQGQQIKVYSQVYKYCYEHNIVVEKDGYICKEDERYTGAHVFPPVPGIYDRVVPFDFASLYPTTMIAYNIDYSTYVTDENIPDSKCHVFEWNDCISCIVGDSNVTFDNFGINIEDLEYNNNLVLSHSENSNLEYKKQLNFFNQGDKKCIEIVFQDGSTLRCTPEHKIMTSENEWIEAQNIIFNETKVKKSIVYPKTKFTDYISDFEIIYGDICLNMKNVHEIEKFCKFSRIFGLMYTDSSIVCRDIVDLNSIMKDIYHVCGQKPICSFINTDENDSYFRIIFPFSYDKHILSLFILDKKFPKILKREFLAGIFGKYRIHMTYHKNVYLCFQEHAEYIQIIQNILKYEFNIESELDEEMNLHIYDIIKFRDIIGFRHCTYKSFILEVIYSYVNFIKIKKVSFQSYLEELNVYKYSDSSKYIMPYYELKVVDIKDIGIHRVYDIEVEDNHSFLADGVIVHNCSHDPKIIRKNELTVYIDSEKEKIKKLREKRDDKKNKVIKQKIVDELNKKVEELKPYIEERTKVVKTISKNVMCAKRYYRFLKEPKGVIPTILQNLLDARKNTRKIIKENDKVIDKIVKENIEIILKKEDSDKVNYLKMLNNVLDKRQWAYKISANSMYGSMGVKRGYLPFMCGAMCVTFMGRTNIEVVAKTIPEKYGGELVYGDTDCVLATEPVLIKYNNDIEYKTVEELSDGNWTRINPNKEISKVKTGYQIWSDNGFTNIINVVRCGIKKPLSRVLTHVGVVNCSNEHSLLTDKLESVTPLDIKIGDKLCISELPLPTDTPKKPLYNNKITKEIIENYIIPNIDYKGLTAELAFAWGLFFADGSCGEYLCGKYVKTCWAINNQDNILLERVLNLLKNNEKTLNFKIYDTMKSSNVNKLEAVQYSRKKEHYGTLINFVNKYRNLFYDDRKFKKIPTIIFNSPFDIRQSFFMGYYSGDGSRKDPALSLSNKGAIGSAGLFYIMKSIGYQVSINTRNDKQDIYKLTGSTPEKKLRRKPNVVKKIINIKADDNEYIYDIQTDNHHFAAGVGQLVVHNSNYIHFPHLKTAKETWDYAEKVSQEVSMLFPKPIKLEFEAVIYWRLTK
jgi:intein/homing endonuclease